MYFYKHIDFGFETQVCLGYRRIQARDLLRVWLFKGFMGGMHPYKNQMKK